MAAVLVFLLLSAFFSVASAQLKSSDIILGSSLSPATNSSWLSPSGIFAFGFYPLGEGFAVGIWFARIPEKTVVWRANRDDPPVPRNATLLLTSDGRLTLQKTQGQIKTIAEASQSASSASMLDSGNFVLYSSNRSVIWQSFDSPTDTLLPGQRFPADKQLFSSNSKVDPSTGRFRLKMQNDGNLVQYPIQTPDTGAYAYWASGTFGQGNNVSLNFNSDGRLYLLNTTGFNIKNVTVGGFPTTRTTVYRMTVDFDGIFRLYSNRLDRNSSWSIVWNSTSNPCDPKGNCGPNAFCILMDQRAACNCLPGFDYVDKEQQSLGCKRISSAENCGDQNKHIKFDMVPLDRTTWENDPYLTLSSITNQEDCRVACLEDCNCEAAVFGDQGCSKQKLPLRYGRRNLDESAIVFVKVGTEGTTSITNGTSAVALKENKNETRKVILIISVVFFTCAIVVLVLSAVLIHRHRVWAYKKISTQGTTPLGVPEEIALRSFTYSELEKVTWSFKEKIGRGSFGTVFKGSLPSGQCQRIVAVKRLEKVVDGEQEFQTEMKAIGRTHHRNLVRLLGYCNDGPNRLLVYEYMSNGSLADFLFIRSEGRPSWDQRVGIAVNIARGILYLHEECETQIIHCDIKPQNILMDEYQCPKIADFGLAKLLKPDQSGTFTSIRGTRGYVAPEWHRKLPITVKADVYSFGIVLLEIVCCRRSVDNDNSGEEAILVDWAYDCFKGGELHKLMRNEEEVVDKRKFERMIRVGLWCIQDEPSLRPSMKKVVLMLEGTVDIPIPPCPSSFLSAAI
ncbi:PREDICTED: G-type lectin S-receptor-like serine/threonine-protein kinase LECRK3 [Nelumbo nucifera]|uniref:Receptor-like serine/threonine-protein kinase n=1 Tax=Nelumbo nucifera TaxID=4432 RepID=A0A1U8AG00_NELNU|nr:PREDICTED: G-type lectin S-receptor-like serine/threonine-protein kinase LECRK3 [Nelumbo nucifera]